MIKTFPRWAHSKVGEDALKALDGLCINLLHNRDNDKLWYRTDEMKTRYRQEEARVGDHFWDGNNGDKHTVVAVDLDNRRLAYRNEDQCEELVQIAVW